jgi:hypothetical protein
VPLVVADTAAEELAVLSIMASTALPVPTVCACKAGEAFGAFVIEAATPMLLSKPESLPWTP